MRARSARGRASPPISLEENQQGRRQTIHLREAGIALPAHLRTTNPIESTFPTVRHRTIIRSKGCLSNRTALAMVFKQLEDAQKSRRRLDGYNQLAKLILGVKLADGAVTKNRR
jgi:hypothetical protein